MKQFRDTPYYVTENGEVFRHYPKREWKTNNKKKRYKPEKFKELKQRPVGTYREYLMVTIYPTPAKPKYLLVHRMVAELYIGKCPEGKEVDHIDENPHNNHYSNLQYLTKKENLAKRWSKSLL